MNIGYACSIFSQIESTEYSDLEKGEAILKVLNMPTHNSITKDMMLRVIRYLFDMVFDVSESEDKAMTRFQYYTESPEWLVKLLHEHYRDEIMFCSPDTPRNFEGFCTEVSRASCDRCLAKWLQGEMEV